MSCLEEKLIELGYRQNDIDLTIYLKVVDSRYSIYVQLKDYNKKFSDIFVYTPHSIINFETIEKIYNDSLNDLQEIIRCL